jgi:hypothetical protein
VNRRIGGGRQDRPIPLEPCQRLLDQGELFAFRVADGVAVWSETFEGVIRGNGSANDTLYVGTLKGLVYAWKAP